MTETEQPIDYLITLLRRDCRISVLTGAGISAPSGVPTFRQSTDEKADVWEHFSPEELATAEAFHQSPKRVWEWYLSRRETISKCEPNSGHQTLAAWERRYPKFTLVTQNVDGLHEEAGSERVIHLHGSIWKVRCTGSCPGEWEDREISHPVLPPRCPTCGSILRPAVLWFGELLPSDLLQQAFHSLDCDIFLAIGTSGTVEPAASFVRRAKAAGAFTVEINPSETEVSDQFDITLRGSADEILERLERRLTIC